MDYIQLHWESRKLEYKSRLMFMIGFHHKLAGHVRGILANIAAD